MALAILRNGVWERWDGWLNEAQHNVYDVERCWSPSDLEDAGLAVIQPAIIPPGKVAVGEPFLVDDNGAPREAYTLEDEPPPPPPTLDDYRQAVQAHIDVTAQQRQYDSGYTCASYVNSTNPQWAAEAQAFIAWRDAVWAYSFAELAKVEDGEREQPTVEQFVAELAAAVPMEWPS